MTILLILIAFFTSIRDLIDYGTKHATEFLRIMNYLFVFYWGFGVNFENQAALSPNISVWFTVGAKSILF